MKLVTHNMLTSRCLRGVTNGYPLIIEAKQVKKCSVDYNPDFVHRLLPKMTWNVLQETAKKFGVELPATNPMPEKSEQRLPDDLCKQIHHALFEIEVIEGDLVCPESGRRFPVKNGIPNMLCNEDEV